MTSSSDYSKTLVLHIRSNKSGTNIIPVEYKIGDLIQTNLAFSIDGNYYHISPESIDDAKKLIQFCENWIEKYQ